MPLPQSPLDESICRPMPFLFTPACLCTGEDLSSRTPAQQITWDIRNKIKVRLSSLRMMQAQCIPRHPHVEKVRPLMFNVSKAAGGQRTRRLHQQRLVGHTRARYGPLQAAHQHHTPSPRFPVSSSPSPSRLGCTWGGGKQQKLKAGGKTQETLAAIAAWAMEGVEARHYVGELWPAIDEMVFVPLTKAMCKFYTLPPPLFFSNVLIVFCFMHQHSWQCKVCLMTLARRLMIGLETECPLSW